MSGKSATNSRGPWHASMLQVQAQSSSQQVLDHRYSSICAHDQALMQFGSKYPVIPTALQAETCVLGHQLFQDLPPCALTFLVSLPCPSRNVATRLCGSARTVEI